MTEVAGTPVYNPPPPAALATRPKSTNTAIYVVCATVLALAAAAVPIVRSMHRSDDSKPAAETSPAPQPAPNPVVAAQPAKVPSPAASRPGPAAPLPRHAAVVGTVIIQPGPQPPARPQLSQEQKDKLDALEPQIDGLKARAAAVNNSLNTMQRQQQSQGYGMRGDIVAKQSSMNLNLGKADQAFRAQDADRAERFAALAEPDIKALETFLGR
jgi:hypothetical protein